MVDNLNMVMDLIICTMQGVMDAIQCSRNGSFVNPGLDLHESLLCRLTILKHLPTTTVTSEMCYEHDESEAFALGTSLHPTTACPVVMYMYHHLVSQPVHGHDFS